MDGYFLGCGMLAISTSSGLHQLTGSGRLDLISKVELVDDSADGMLAGRSAIRAGTVRANNRMGFDVRSVRVKGEMIGKCLPKWLSSFVGRYQPGLLRVENCIMTDQEVTDLVKQPCINNVHFSGCIVLKGDTRTTLTFAAQESITFVECQFITSAEIYAPNVNEITIMSSDFADAQLNGFIGTAFALTRFSSDAPICDLALATVCKNEDLVSLELTSQDLSAIAEDLLGFCAIHLKFLALRDCTAEISICKVLKQLDRLDYVILEGRSATNETVQALLPSSATLRSLLVSGEAIDDRVLDVAKKMPALTTLMIRETNISKAALSQFSEGFKGRILGQAGE